MDDIIALVDKFSGLSIFSKWSELIALYEDIDTHSANFTHSLDISCPTACGTCCEHFIPDVNFHEATLIASYIMCIKKDLTLLSLINPEYEGNGCPLYYKDDPFHCQIYPVRTLVCRLFGASPSKTKYGMPIFRKCKYNSDEHQQPVITSDEIFDKVQDIQTMQDASGALQSLLVETESQPLHIALFHAINHLTLISSYIAASDEQEPLDRPDPSSPIAV